MNPVQLPFLVEGIILLTAAVFGLLLYRSGKPYGKVKLVVHLFFFIWFSAGFGFITFGIITMKAASGIWVPVFLIGLAILAQLITGIMALALKNVGKALPKVHMFSAILMLLSDICAFIIAGVR